MWRKSRMKPSRKRTIVKPYSGLSIRGGTEDKRLELVEIIKTHFTPREVKLLQDVDFVFSNHESNDAGAYTIEFDTPIEGTVEITSKPRVTFYRSAHWDVMDHVVMIHEIIHHLRVFDPFRRGVQGRLSIDTDVIERKLGDNDLEEALTEAETIARQDPFQQRTRGGYYDYVSGNPDAARRHDRYLITESKSIHAPIWGQEAIKNTAKHFPNTAIASLSIDGKSEAIERFWHIREEGKPGFILHKTYDPQGESVIEDIHRRFPKAKSIYELRDDVPYHVYGHK